MTTVDDDCTAYSAQVRTLNDAFRTSLRGGSVMLTSGIIALGVDWQDHIVEAIKIFGGFNADNDPWDEHDFGALIVNGERVYFKIDYFDRAREWHSPDPANADVTERVMTIMLASEY